MPENLSQTWVLSWLALDCDVDCGLDTPLAVGRIIPCVNSAMEEQQQLEVRSNVIFIIPEFKSLFIMKSENSWLYWSLIKWKQINVQWLI